MCCVHNWGWPRRDKARKVDVQTCTRCGAQRDSKIQFRAGEPVQDLFRAGGPPHTAVSDASGA